MTQACSFAASNQGNFVADVFLQAISGRETDYEYHKHVLRRIKGAPTYPQTHSSVQIV